VSGGPTVAQQIRYRVLIAGIWLLCRAPERPLLAVADLIGDIWYRLGQTRRARGRRNLARVTRWMAEHDVGSDRGRLAGRDSRVLERLVRDAFRQSVRYNLILARGSTMDARYVRRRVSLETPGVLEAALAEPAGALFVGLHMGSMELPALYLSQITGRPAVAPTERLRDPLVQAHMVRARLRLGLRLVELSVAKREMIAALRRGDPVGIVGDRDLTGGGIEVPFFGAPASLPVGPALLALETGVIPHVFGVRRTPDGVYHLVIVRVPLPEQGTRRERVTAYLEAEAGAFERMVALAPEQWFAVFFDLWKDDAP
jgi:KDO2-lipid IV(A) lauroyltransferase